jgi:Holliday junction resolvase RusA-like endonuclease
VISITIPGIPPSVNHYRGLNRRAGRFYVRKPAIAFKADVALMLAGRKMPKAKAYRVEVTIYLPKGKRGDVDNFAKVTLDALQAAGAIRSDALIAEFSSKKLRDAANPRTEITISTLKR